VADGEHRPGTPDWFRRDAERNERARLERLRRDGARDLGENILEADELIRFAYQFAGAATSGTAEGR
jgi:hypothetical protein